MSRISISVIVPCYNCEKYIERNIKSILSQTYKHFEVIYIDDGSKDNSLEILKQYESIDKRIKVIHTENKGVSHARNLGLENATGRYIAFIDADDYIDNQYLEKLYRSTNNEKMDYVKCLKVDKRDFKMQEKIYIKDNGDFEKIYDILLETYELSSVCCSLIRNDFIKNNKIKFDENYCYAEDYGFIIDLFKYIKKFNFINYRGYYYYYNPASLTRKIEAKSVIHYIEATIVIYSKLYVFFKNEKSKVDRRIEREIKHILDSLFYANTRIRISERFYIYDKMYVILDKRQEFCSTFDMKLLYKKLYIIYDIKNCILKKVPRKIKRFLMKGI